MKFSSPYSKKGDLLQCSSWDSQKWIAITNELPRGLSMVKKKLLKFILKKNRINIVSCTSNKKSWVWTGIYGSWSALETEVENAL